MTNPDPKSTENKDGIDVTKVTFDENGEVTGLDVKDLDDVSGGIFDNGNCPCNRAA